MAINLGLRKEKEDELKELLRSPHWIKVTITVLDMEHRYLADLSDRLLSGQVNFDSSAEVSRTLDLALSDPYSTLALNPDSPEDGALFMDKMIKVVYSVAPPIPTHWYDIPLFCGPITGFNRDDDSVSLTASGKDVLAKFIPWKERTFKPNRKLTDLAREVLREMVGETKMSIPDKARRNGKQVVVGAQTVPLMMLKKWAGSLGLNAFWDGRGTFKMVKRGKIVSHRFDGRNMLTTPKFTYDPSTVVNAVKVIGGKPRGGKNKAVGRAVAPAGHPLSPAALGRNGVPRYYTQVIEDSSLKTSKACEKRAREALEQGLRESLNIEFNCLPWPLMEEGDSFSVNTEEIDMTARAVQWAIGLTHDGVMSVGVIRKVSFKTRRKGKNKGRHKGRNGRPRTKGRRR